jgi:hypothetical protein
MVLVSTMLTDVPAARATTPGVCGSQLPAAMVASGNSVLGSTAITFGAPASTPQMRKPASSTVAKPRPPWIGHKTSRMELSEAPNSTTCSKSGCARLRIKCRCAI